MCDSRRRIKSTSTTINVLHWDDLKQLADGIELEAGVGTVNAASFQLPVEMKQKLSSMLSTSTSAKTLLVQYKAVGEFEVEFLPRYIAYQRRISGSNTGTIISRVVSMAIAAEQSSPAGESHVLSSCPSQVADVSSG
ncbi:hypothetical protein Moror_15686 [Moniliophthora roreri MCA 2997]|uniref:Uncharacterized protein n=1 Tax=Moniliophthora roreri (strain MCA 2997) TaxID=1381753 RepID=V2WLS8_MONRO|nr:hypothetical protein Moror_15686 [Moniliophthora roreri MCA 2997]